MRLIPYLSFDGQCREAFDFYAAALRGTLLGPPMTYGERVADVRRDAAGIA